MAKIELNVSSNEVNDKVVSEKQNERSKNIVSNSAKDIKVQLLNYGNEAIKFEIDGKNFSIEPGGSLYLNSADFSKIDEGLISFYRGKLKILRK